MFGCSSTTLHQKSISPKNFFNKQQIEELNSHLKVLSSDEMAGREFAKIESKQAQNYIVSSLASNKVQPFQNRFRHLFEHKSFLSQKTGSNIIGFVKGTHFPDQYIVLSAHYDHLGKKGSKVYNGADDNASGVAAVLIYAQEIAKKPLKHSVIFLFTDGEEVSLLGAKAFISQQQWLLPQIKLNINIDMIAGSKSTNKLHFIDRGLGNIFSQDEIEGFKLLSQSSNVKIKRGFKREFGGMGRATSWLTASDHGVFNREQIPFIYFGVGEHRNYHTIDDNYDNINHLFYAQAVQTIFQYLLFADNSSYTNR